MEARKAVQIVVALAHELPEDTERGEALRTVLALLRERDNLARELELPVRKMGFKLAAAIGE